MRSSKYLASTSGLGLGNVAGLGAIEHHVVHGALLVAEPVERVERSLGHGHFAAHRADQLLAQQVAALLGQEALLGEADLTDQVFELGAVELTVDAAETLIFQDAARHLLLGDTELERAGTLVEHGFRDHLREHLAIDAGEPCLLRRHRAAHLAAELLQPVLVGLAEGVDSDLGVANLGDGRLAEAAENVADAPDAEADRDQAEQNAHDDAAEPIGRGFVNTSKHGSDLLIGNSDSTTADGRNIRIALPPRN